MGKLYDLRYDYCKGEWLKRRTGTDEEWEHASLVDVAEYAWPPAEPYLAALEDVVVAARALVPDLQHMRSTNAALRLLILRLDELDGKTGG